MPLPPPTPTKRHGIAMVCCYCSVASTENRVDGGALFPTSKNKNLPAFICRAHVRAGTSPKNANHVLAGRIDYIFFHPLECYCKCLVGAS